MQDQHYWLGFSLIPEIGPKRLAYLRSYFGDLASAWNASETALRHCGLDSLPLENLLTLRKKLDLPAEMAKVERLGVQLVTLTDDDYPALLRTIPDAPTVLYIRGSLISADEPSLAIVGTRKASSYGRDVAFSLSKALARESVAIVSGLAQGIDSAAHQGALDGGGRTIAVLGCGIDIVYPAANKPLAGRIVENGALISEFPIGTPPEGRNFPRRNRIISGLSLGVLLVEAPEQSGALLTVEKALEQGRDVFAVPGSIFSPISRGPNRLIQDGAKLVNDVRDILDEMNIAQRNMQVRQTTEKIAPANDVEASLLGILGHHPIHIDDLVRQSGVPVTLVSSTLTLLELKGLIQIAGSMQYTLAPDGNGH